MVGVREFLLVERYASALCELAHLSLRREYLGVLCQQLYGRLAYDGVAWYLVVWYTSEDIKQCLLVKLQQRFLGRFPEEYV